MSPVKLDDVLEADDEQLRLISQLSPEEIWIVLRVLRSYIYMLRGVVIDQGEQLKLFNSMGVGRRKRDKSPTPS